MGCNIIDNMKRCRGEGQKGGGEIVEVIGTGVAESAVFWN